ncbi:MAG: recR [Parcubacteria group bacterium]|nr:recR [Parcubacteria group bacterium]
MNSIDKLTEIFSRFPGIGPRQAKRFVYYLLQRHNGTTDDLIRALDDLKLETSQCSRCYRFFPKNHAGSNICSICTDKTRDESLLMIVPRDTDLDAVEKSRSFKGLYFVLGGVLPVLEREPEKRIRINELRERVKRDEGVLKEIILAMNANTEGENTSDFLKGELKVFQEASFSEFTISILGRGLSTGAELEYADPDTLKNALLHRTK